MRRIFNKRAKLKLESINDLSKNIPLGFFILATPEIHKSNDWYGNATFLKEYAGIDKNYKLKAVIEHGLYFGDSFWQQDIDSNLPIILTLNKKRVAFLKKKTNKEIFAIGPYIHYVKPYYNENEHNSELKRLGKSLLVFPTHSTSVLFVSYDAKPFIKEIKRIAKDFDTVRVCLYWKDILLKMDEQYRLAGFECITAGHIFDPLFTSRLKSIISLSSSTITNSIGTYTGYCIYMGKPHFWFKQDLKHWGEWGDPKAFTQAAEDVNLISDAFSNYRDDISKYQYTLTKSYWGFDQIKTPRQIRKIFEKGEQLYKKHS